MSTDLTRAPLIPEARLARHFNVSAEVMRSTGVEPAFIAPTGRSFHSLETAERVAERLHSRERARP